MYAITARIAPILLVVTALSACTSMSPATRFYHLGQAEIPSPPGGEQREFRVGLGPIELPEMLRRPQMVSRKGSAEMEIADFHRWAGDLEDMMARELTLQLRQISGGPRIVPHPWSTQRHIDYQLRISVLRFDGTLGKEFALQGMWILSDTRERQELVTRSFDLRRPAGDASHAAMAKVMGELLARLGDEIGTALKQIDRP